MKHKDYVNLLFDRASSAIALTSGPKHDEYGRSADTLENWKVQARILGCAPEEALRGCWAKHIYSTFRIIEEAAKYGIVPDRAYLNEKMNDMHNYLFLLEALIEDRRKDIEPYQAESDVPKG